VIVHTVRSSNGNYGILITQIDLQNRSSLHIVSVFAITLRSEP